MTVATLAVIAAMAAAIATDSRPCLLRGKPGEV